MAILSNLGMLIRLINFKIQMLLPYYYYYFKQTNPKCHINLNNKNYHLLNIFSSTNSNIYVHKS